MTTLRDYSGEDIGFFVWLEACDRIIGKELGLGLLDLPDQTWRDWYEDALSPQDAVESCREEMEADGCDWPTGF